jgi:outer membrane biosynthesis protein TonB
MFGQDDQNNDISTVNPTLDGDTSVTPAADTPVDSPANDVAAAAAAPTIIEPAAEAAPAETDVTPAETPEVEATAPETTPATPEEPVEETPVVDTPTPVEDTTDTPTPTGDPALLDLKKQALEELSPLLDQLDQTPEEKFKTTMMMIQATDSSDLVNSAHEAALQITDEKVRAQALLDIVNEINYFTQPKE